MSSLKSFGAAVLTVATQQLHGEGQFFHYGLRHFVPKSPLMQGVITHGSILLKRNLKDQFLASFRAYAGDDDYRLRVVSQQFDEADESIALFNAGLNTVSHAYLNRALEVMERMLEAAESPIEESMIYALCVLAHENATNVTYKLKGCEYGDRAQEPDYIIIQPQAQLGEYRVDFLLEMGDWIPDFDNPIKRRDGIEIPGVMKAEAKLIIECDGHAFHDRTKEQASEDRARDRQLSKLGFKVFRYTGSDIWKDVFSCASEAMSTLHDEVWKK